MIPICAVYISLNFYSAEEGALWDDFRLQRCIYIILLFGSLLIVENCWKKKQ